MTTYSIKHVAGRVGYSCHWEVIEHKLGKSPVIIGVYNSLEAAERTRQIFEA